MKKLLFTLISFTFITSCTLTEEPEFLKIDGFQIIKANKKSISIKADAHFHNPNDVGCEVTKTNVKVLVNDLHVSDVNQINSIELESDNNFYLPMKVSIPFDKIAKDKNGILGGVMSALLDKNVKVKYKGIVTLKKAGIEFDIDIEGEEILKEFKRH